MSAGVDAVRAVGYVPYIAPQSAGKSISTGKEEKKADDSSWQVVKKRKDKAGETTIASVPAPSSPAPAPAAAAAHPMSRLDVDAKDFTKTFSARVERNKKAARVVNLVGEEILAVRYSQSSIAAQTKNEEPLWKLKKQVRDWNDAEPLPLVRGADGLLTSIGNRRLFCLKEIVRKILRQLAEGIMGVKPLKITATIYNHDEIAPVDWIVKERAATIDFTIKRSQTPFFEQDRKKKQLSDEIDLQLQWRKIKPGSYGELIYLRTLSSSHPYGFTEDPVVRAPADRS